MEPEVIKPKKKSARRWVSLNKSEDDALMSRSASEKRPYSEIIRTALIVYLTKKGEEFSSEGN